MAFLQECKEANGGKRGKPYLSAAVTKLKTNVAIPVPAPKIRFDSVGHLLDFVDKQGRCRHCPRGFTSIHSNTKYVFVSQRTEILFTTITCLASLVYPL